MQRQKPTLKLRLAVDIPQRPSQPALTADDFLELPQAKTGSKSENPPNIIDIRFTLDLLTMRFIRLLYVSAEFMLHSLILRLLRLLEACSGEFVLNSITLRLLLFLYA